MGEEVTDDDAGEPLGGPSSVPALFPSFHMDLMLNDREGQGDQMSRESVPLQTRLVERAAPLPLVHEADAFEFMM